VSSAIAVASVRTAVEYIDTRKESNVWSVFVMRVLLTECSQTQEVVFVQEIILLGCISRYEAVFVVDSTYIAQRAVPKWLDEGTPRELHCMAVSAT
jgi:hypothetical protein